MKSHIMSMQWPHLVTQASASLAPGSAPTDEAAHADEDRFQRTPTRLVTTDVFDTLLLKGSRSARSRLIAAEESFSRQVASQGFPIAPDVLLEARLTAERLAFRALEVRGIAGEVRLADVIGRQLAILGLPSSFAALRISIELHIEKLSLTPNPEFVAYLRGLKQRGLRIVAVSDTMLTGNDVCEMIASFYGADLIDRVYSSADVGLTKRRGDLFKFVAQSEGVGLSEIVHFGDDINADKLVPSASGVMCHHLPRPIFWKYARQVNGAFAEGVRFCRTKRRSTRPVYHDTRSFGREVFGPIVTELCLRMWLYATQADACSASALLFCARGGLGMRESFERVALKLGLPLDMRRGNLMISRLVAARSAILAEDESAVEELDREFRGSTLADVLNVLGGSTYDLPDIGNEPFRAKDLMGYLAGPAGSRVLQDIRRQDLLFMRHLDELGGDAAVLILCDTGLYGSTQRLLSSALPTGRLESILFARCNYKGHSESHFPKTTGLLTSQKYYTPFDNRSSVLRYWHLIESLFEPLVPSVKTFSEDCSGQVISNCGDVRFGTTRTEESNELLSGVFDYIDDLRSGGGAKALCDAPAAWQCLQRSICFPSDLALRCLTVDARSVDFGRAAKIDVLGSPSSSALLGGLRGLKRGLWKEGSIAQGYPMLKHLLLPLLHVVFSMRGVVSYFFDSFPSLRGICFPLEGNGIRVGQIRKRDANAGFAPP